MSLGRCQGISPLFIHGTLQTCVSMNFDRLKTTLNWTPSTIGSTSPGPESSSNSEGDKMKITSLLRQLLLSVRSHFVPRHFVPGHILSRDNMSPGQYVALCPHYFAVQMGDILSQETYCPGSVRRHFVPGDVLSRFGKATFCPGRRIVPVGNKW